MSAAKQVLVVYYSLTGNTARVAKDLAARLGADLESIRDEGHGIGALGRFHAAFDAWRKLPAKIEAPRYDPADYAMTVVSTPVWVGQMTPGTRAYLQQARERIRNVAFFITSGATDISRLTPSLESVAGKKAIATVGFDGRELANAAVYERKLTAFADQIAAACSTTRKVA